MNNDDTKNAVQELRWEDLRLVSGGSEGQGRAECDPYYHEGEWHHPNCDPGGE